MKAIKEALGNLRFALLLGSADRARRLEAATALGATGTPAAVAAAAAAFAVPYAKVSLPEGGYTMDHGSGIFIVGPSGGIVAYSSAPHDASTIARL